MTTLCTLFDHNYLDKGLVMYESLEKVCDEFELFVLCMSERCYEILTDLKYAHLKPIKLEDFEDEELLRIKPTRGVGEYCWTCSSSLIRYVLKTYQPEYCAYIDSDLYFYSDPKVVVEEMKQKGASVQITGHRFDKDLKSKEKIVGKYCVEYNTFKNDAKALSLLEVWRNQCIERCSIDGDGIHWGDQKYLDNWCQDYDFVIETSNLGMGVAPWNIAQYCLIDNKKDIILECNNLKLPLVFYHFQELKYLDKRTVRLNVYTKPSISYKLVHLLYYNYLQSLNTCKEMLFEKYAIDTIIRRHPGRKSPHNEDGILRLINLRNFLTVINPMRWLFLYRKRVLNYDIIKL